MIIYLEYITQPLLLQSYVILFLISFIFCSVIILSADYGFNRRAAVDETAIQSAHTGHVPRVGGLAVCLSILGIIPISTVGLIPLSVFFEIEINVIGWLIFSAAPVFLVGLAEDLGYPMNSKRRLMAAVFSSFLVIVFFEVWVSQVGIWGVDFLLSITGFGIAFTLFATAGVVNAFNLIDGLNGLSSYITISTASALSVIAFKVGNDEVTLFLTLSIAATLGFMIFNFPFGKIFLGDAGAYALGHLLVWSAIILVNYDQSISPFAILLIFFWPIADTGLAIWRRWKLGTPADRPDRLHFHQLAMRLLEIRFLGREQRKIANPLATVILIPLISTPQTLGILFWRDFSASVLGTIGMGFLFTLTYAIGVKSAKKSRAVGK